MPAFVPLSDRPAEPTEAGLRRRIGLISHVLRGAAVVYVLWALIGLLVLWHDPTGIDASWTHRFQLMAPIPWQQRLAGLAVCLLNWSFVVAACVNLWRLTSAFLAGRIFTLEAAAALRRAALWGLAAGVADILFRPVLFVLMTLHMPPGQRQIGLFLMPTDLLDLMLLAGFLALAEVFRAAAEIADDNARIV